MITNHPVRQAPIFLADLWCEVPFYNAYLCDALRQEGVESVLGSISFHLEPGYFRSRGIRNNPGVSDLVSRMSIKNAKLRRSLKLIEFCANVTSLAFRFLIAPPGILHIQWLSLIEQGITPELWLLRLAKKRGIKVAYTVHNFLPHDSGSDLRKIYSRVYEMVDVLICHTRDTKERLVREFGIKSEKVWIIPHGPLFYDHRTLNKAEARQRLGLSPNDCVFLYQGYVRPYKGIDFLLESWKAVQSAEPRAKLVVAGRGEERHMKVIRAKVKEMALQSSVRLDLRYIPTQELPVYYQAADVAVYPHREITQSGSLMTGIAFQKRIIATTLPGFREALDGYSDAFFVNPDDVNGLSQLLLQSISRGAKTESRQTGASVCDPEASWRNIGMQTRRCYELLLAPQLPGCAEQTQELTS